MKIKKSILFFVFSVLVSGSFAQTQHVCGADEKRKKLIEQNPTILQKEAQLEQFTQGHIQQNANNRSGQVYTIPVVFHIIHQYGSENISDAQVIDAVNILNRDYRKLNADTAAIVAPFDTLAADANIEFRLATIDPFGNCTNGIEHIASVQTYIGDDESKLNAWPRHKYLNVWVVAQMENGVAGYAYYPSAVDAGFITLRDGVIILHNYVGSIGTSNVFNSRALTHEVGHWLNLQHVWGNTNDPGVACGDDMVNDTPESIGWTTCNLSGSVCNPPVVENVQNYMEYSYCSKMFTEGQVARMIAALNSPMAYRNNLWTAANLAATGTDGITNLACAPDVEFNPDEFMVCLNETVTFRDRSTKGVPTSWNWTFQDGTPATSTTQNPSVSFNTPGWKVVSMTASNAEGTDALTQWTSIYVSPGTAIAGWPYLENFESHHPYNIYYMSNNLENNTTNFDYYTGAGSSGNSCVMLDAFNMVTTPFDDGAGDIDELVTPSFDLTGLSGLSLTFRYAYATQATVSDDITEELRVYSSVDCGKTWVQRKLISGINLCSGGNFGQAYVPADPADWAQDAILISASLQYPDVRFKFVYTSGIYSNNLFIDDINIGNGTGVEESANIRQISVIPNPASDNAILQFDLLAGEQGVIEIMDMTGKIISTQNTGALNVGQNRIDLSVAELPKGIYLVRVQTASGAAVVRFCKI